MTNPTQALLDHLGPTSLTWFEAVCPTLRCFAVSSAGVVPDKVRPIGLNDVLDWLEEHRARRIRTARAAVVRGRALDLVKRWGVMMAKGGPCIHCCGDRQRDEIPAGVTSTAYRTGAHAVGA